LSGIVPPIMTPNTIERMSESNKIAFRSAKTCNKATPKIPAI